MTATALLDRIGNVFVHQLNIQAPSPDIELIESGTIDSLTFVELLAHLEREFSIRIPLEIWTSISFDRLSESASSFKRNFRHPR